MKVCVVVEAYKGCIENVYVYKVLTDAQAKLDEIKKDEDFNEDEDDAQLFSDIEVDPQHEAQVKIKRGDHSEPHSEYTAIFSGKKQLAFVQRYGKGWAAWLDALSPEGYIWFLGERETREEAEKLMFEKVNEKGIKISS